MVFKGLRPKRWKQKGEQQKARREQPEEAERSWGEDAIETAKGEAAEGTPSGMTRLKTDKL